MKVGQAVAEIMKREGIEILCGYPVNHLLEFAAAADDTLGALARSTGLEQSTLSRNLRTLEGQGLIEIAVVESDLRRRAVWLTETGARRLEAAIPVWRRAHARLGKLLSPSLPRRLAAQAEALAAD